MLVVVLSGSEEPRDFEPAPAACIEHWNADEAALAFGTHQSGAHGYYEVQVLTLTNDGQSLAEPGSPGASCAVVFAASALDPEPISAAQIEKRGAWLPLSQLADTTASPTSRPPPRRPTTPRSARTAASPRCSRLRHQTGPAAASIGRSRKRLR